METLQCAVKDLYYLRACLGGWKVDDEVKQHAFVSEAGLTEGTRRIATKALRLLNVELTPIDARRNEVASYTEEGKTDAELVAIREAKEKEILDDVVSIQIEKIDFKKVEDLSFIGNYEFLYQKLFKNYE
jgi:hypothetical protein